MIKNISAQPFIIWFTGISGSGKTALSLFCKKKIKYKIKVIDGDLFRKKLSNFNYDLESREKIGYKKALFAKKLYKQGYSVIVSGIGHKKKWRKKIRKIIAIDNYFEIYLKCPINICRIRKKKFYEKFNTKQIVGQSGEKFKYEEYKECDLKILTHKFTLNESFKKIFNFLKKKYEII